MSETPPSALASPAIPSLLSPISADMLIWFKLQSLDVMWVMILKFGTTLWDRYSQYQGSTVEFNIYHGRRHFTIVNSNPKKSADILGSVTVANGALRFKPILANFIHGWFFDRRFAHHLKAVSHHFDVVSMATTSLAVDAFSCGIRNGALATAVELVEHGHAVFWTQLVHFHTTLDELSMARHTGAALGKKILLGSVVQTRSEPELNPPNPFAGVQSRVQPFSLNRTHGQVRGSEKMVEEPD
ncbi:hypothetical protein CY34DRAFT_16983 [Suillus luteus UH-Slu-Lm8-n1]|uniref:Uncharacterized protein n=1 Tax=Suillus luteus UH-Slu-Lm8-n1 TaxID=930992 RepID=A0A0D0ABT1_9AGAM|nr:hypothetical protein CY34DRAFT_16983 [Suillus luteus UH-Slu-Lm8-n1]